MSDDGMMTGNPIRLFIFCLLVFLIIHGSSDYLFCQTKQTPSTDSLNIYLKGAAGLSVGPNGNIYIVDRGLNRIIRCSMIDSSHKITADYSWKDAADNYPRDIVTVNGLDIYVADYNNHRILRFDRDLNFISSFPPDVRNYPEGRIFGYPLSISADRFGSLYVLDGENKRIVKIGKSNQVERVFGGYDAGAGRLNSPVVVRVNDYDHVFVQDENRIVVFDVFGNYIRTIGTALFTKLTAFALDRDVIYTLDGCKVLILSEEGVPKDTILVRQTIPGYNCADVVAMDAKQGGLYLLNEHTLFMTWVGKQPVHGKK